MQEWTTDKGNKWLLAPILVLKLQKKSVRGSVKTLGSMYAITIKQNINTAMFGLVKKQTCISKTLHAQFKAPQRQYRFNIKFFSLSKSIQIKVREIVLCPHCELFLIDLIKSFFQTFLIFSFWSLPCSTYEHYALKWDTDYLSRDRWRENERPQ